VPLTAVAYTDGTYDLSIERLPAKTPVLEVNSSGYVRLRTTHGGVVNVLDPAGLMLCSDPKGCVCPGQPHPAIFGFEISRRSEPGASAVRGIGDEAWISVAPPGPSPNGQVLEGATAAVRVHNIDVSLSITGNEMDAGRGAVLHLLSQIASEL
jgi:hypothetical protein